MLIEKFKEYAKTITKEEFLNKAHEEIEIDNLGISCPSDIGLRESKYCTSMTFDKYRCYNCWEKATFSIIFKK